MYAAHCPRRAMLLSTKHVPRSSNWSCWLGWFVAPLLLGSRCRRGLLLLLLLSLLLLALSFVSRRDIHRLAC